MTRESNNAKLLYIRRESREDIHAKLQKWPNRDLMATQVPNRGLNGSRLLLSRRLERVYKVDR